MEKTRGGCFRVAFPTDKKFADATDNSAGATQVTNAVRSEPSNDISAVLELGDYFVINKRDMSLSKQRDPK